MAGQIWKLGRLQLCNLWGMNEIRYMKDKKKKMRYLGIAGIWMVLLLCMIWYLFCFCNLLGKAGMAGILPVYLYVMVSLMILFFTFLKAGEMIFQIHTYEMLISLPISRAAIVISRFLAMYVTNFLLGLLIMVPGTAVYGYYLRPGISFYLYSAVGIVFLPLLPITVASILGALLKGITSRMRHRSLGEAGLMILTVLLMMGGSTFFSGRAEELSPEMLLDMTSAMAEVIGRCYPPALWYDRAVKGQPAYLAMLTLVSAAVFLLFTVILQKYFQSVCQALCTSAARNDFKMQRLHQNSMLKALWKREMRRYFASGIYISNTLVGYVLMVAMAGAACALGVEKAEKLLGFSGVAERMFPMVLALMASMMTTTACSVSMEGNCWWIVQSLPVRNRQVYDSKILVNLSIAAPFYGISVLLSCLALKPGLATGIWLVTVPAVYILFTAVMGLAINLRFPVLEWESEVRVVKQSASTMLTLLVGAVSVILPAAALLLQDRIADEIILGGTVILLLVLTAFVYNRNNRIDLKRINAE